MISKGFYEYLEIIADERRLEKEDVFKAVEIALIKAAQAEGKHEYPTPFRSESTRASAIPTFAKVRAYPNTCFHKINYFKRLGMTCSQIKGERKCKYLPRVS